MATTVPDATPQPGALLRYSNVAVALHWLIALLVVGQIAGGFLFESMPRGPERGQVFTLHKTFGVIILLLTLVRLAWRLSHKPPPYPDDLPRWERVVATWNHRLFYVLLIALPLTGLAAVSARADGPTTDLVGGIPFPVIPGVPEDAPFGNIHGLLVFATLALLALHIGAAVKHQFIDRARASGRMPPFKPATREPTTPA